jgi:hypothetical protein
MDSATGLVLVVIVALAVVAIGFWMVTRRRRSRDLREHFGPEYDRAVNEYGDRRPAERALEARAERVEQLHIQPLPRADRDRYAEEWRAVQGDFVDDPELAIAQADHLVAEVMQARGYPMANFEQRAADVSVDHPHVVEHYRAARDIARRATQGEAATEDLRQAMVHYRFLFDDLIGASDPATQEVSR